MGVFNKTQCHNEIIIRKQFGCTVIKQGTQYTCSMHTSKYYTYTQTLKKADIIAYPVQLGSITAAILEVQTCFKVEQVYLPTGSLKLHSCKSKGTIPLNTEHRTSLLGRFHLFQDGGSNGIAST